MASSVKSEASSNALKLERPEDILKLDRNEIVVKLEKGEGTLKIEKIGSALLKVEGPSDVVVKPEKSDVSSDTLKVESPESVAPVKLTDSENAQESIAASEGDASQLTNVSGAESKQDVESTISDNDKTEISLNSQESISEAKSETDTIKQDNDEQEPEKEIQDNSDKSPETAKDPVSSESIKEEDLQLPNDNLNNNTENQCSEKFKDESNADSVKQEEQEPMEEEPEKDSEESKKILETKMETGSVKSESDKNSVKEDIKTELTVTTDISKANSSASTEVVDRFKAMFPELEVMHKLPEIDTTVVAEKQSTIAQLLQQSYQNPIKWPKVRCLSSII